jgi:hypothetical protein
MLLLGAPGTAEAYCRTSTCPSGVAGETCTPAEPSDCGVPLSWPVRCLGFSVQQAASEQVSWSVADEIVNEAFATWLAADCGGGSGPGFRVADLGAVACAARQYNQSGGNANIVVFRDDAWPYAGQWSTLALTTVTYHLDTGVIYDADLEVNSSNVSLTTSDTDVGFDLLSIITHETGHMLGIAHSREPDSTMGRQYLPGDLSLRDLAPDDVAAICAVYPPVAAGAPGDPASCDPTPRHGFTGECGPFPEPEEDGCAVREPRRARGTLALLVVGLAIAARSVRRRGPSAASVGVQPPLSCRETPWRFPW